MRRRAIRSSFQVFRLEIGTQVRNELARVGWKLFHPADADRQFAHGPLVGERDRADRHRWPNAPSGGLWDNANADVAFDQTADRIETAQLDAQLQWFADARRLVGEKALDGAGPVETDEFLIEHFRKADGRPVCKRM